MRLLLDAHVSARRIAGPLRDAGHDVRAADEERALDGWDDERLLELAATEQRIMVTFNVRDFAPIAQTWAGERRHHAGCVILVGIDHSEFGVILTRLADELATRPDPHAWRDYTAFIGRHRC
ncbi:MAG TPA: DUF5615 family PIN-like protein [Solirubrobacteraceae bacterium]|nr:DUF5615 family PIN-like protein [Solirubrobacteraceae bacterium]